MKESLKAYDRIQAWPTLSCKSTLSFMLAILFSCSKKILEDSGFHAT